MCHPLAFYLSGESLRRPPLEEAEEVCFILVLEPLNAL